MLIPGTSLIAGGVKSEFGSALPGTCVYVKITCNGEAVAKNSQVDKLPGFLAQQIQTQVSKQPRQVYEIGSNLHYVIDARPSGSGSIAHLIGPNTQDVFEKLSSFANVCNKTDVLVGVYKNCACGQKATETTQGGEVTFKDGVLNSIQLSTTAQDYVVTSNIGFMFSDAVYGIPPNKPADA